ncbi:cupin domain-containing protein [Nocardia sp. NPDC004568]|uniref:cupin domain-containing protein n=1 Tax=Nocardia sp. NPDC004568 TaxID=3154551 RepID=UPI0033B32F71
MRNSEMECVQTKSALVARPVDSTARIGRQGQNLTPCITRGRCGATNISAGYVNMPPGKSSRAHFHAHSEVVVVCTDGYAATLIGPDLIPHFHGPGEFMYIPEGVIHVAVNLSGTHNLIAVEMRTDPEFDDDVVLTPELETRAQVVAAELRRVRAAVV